LENYLFKSPERERFSTLITLDFKNIITINEVLKNDKEQLLNIAELILFLLSICSKKNYYLDKLSELEDVRIINAFFNYIEKYILLDNKLDETTNLNQSQIEKSFVINNHLAKFKEEYFKERELLVKTIRDNEKIIFTLNEKNELLEKKYTDLELKFKDREREFDLIKKSQNYHLKFQEEMLNDDITITDLKNQILQKDIEINEIKRESELNLQTSFEEIKKLKEKLETYEERLSEFKTLKIQNEKLNTKIKELLIIREKNEDYEELKNLLENKNKQIEKHLKEKTYLSSQIEKLNKDILTEKEKSRQAEYDRKKMDYDLNEIKKECTRLENLKNINNMTNILHNNLQMNLNNISEVRKPQNLNNSELHNEEKLFDLGGESMILDELKDLRTNKNFSDKDYQDLKNEKNELVKLYKSQVDEIHLLIEEKDRLLNKIDSLKLEIEKHLSEKERIYIEKEKLEIQTQKSDLDCQKLKIHIERYESERKRMDEEIKDLCEKIEILNSEKGMRVKENESLKNLLTNNQNLSDKILLEKQNLIKEYQNLQLEFEKFKSEYGIINSNTSIYNNSTFQNNPGSNSSKKPRVSLFSI
jgi:hypothetical protein